MKKYKFEIYIFEERTRQVRLTATYKTKPIEEKQLKKLIRKEMKNAKKPCCYRILE